jgi:hypothetical protein
MSRDVQSGVEKLATVLADRQEEQSTSGWRDLRNKLDSLLLSTHTLKTDEARKRCQALDGMTMEERANHIKLYWGTVCLDRVMPLLQQLEAVEKAIAANQP